MKVFPLSLWLSGIPQCACTTSSLSNNLPKGTLVDSTSWSFSDAIKSHWTGIGTKCTPWLLLTDMIPCGLASAHGCDLSPFYVTLPGMPSSGMHVLTKIFGPNYSFQVKVSSSAYLSQGNSSRCCDFLSAALLSRYRNGILSKHNDNLKLVGQMWFTEDLQNNKN